MSKVDSRPLKCKTFNPDASSPTITISGRVRLFAFSSVGTKTASSVLVFKNGDRGGDVVLSISRQPEALFGVFQNIQRFSPSGILFPDGLFLETGNTGDAADNFPVSNASLFYQGGG